MPPLLLVERALALVPDSEEFLPLSDAVIGSSLLDREKIWAGSGAYATVGKRVVDAVRLGELIPDIVSRAQRRLQERYEFVLTAIQEQQAGDFAAAAATLIRAGEMEEADRRPDKAEKMYAMALEISRELRRKEPQILALRRLGRAARSEGRLADAWSWYEQSYHLSTDEMDRPGQVIACQGLGNLCHDRGQRVLSRSWYERGLTLARSLEDPALEWPFHTNLSMLAMEGGQLDEAETLLARARTCIEAVGGSGAMLYWFNNRGLLLLESGEAVGAEAAFREGLSAGSDAFWEMTMRVNLGQALVRQGRLFEADAEARLAEEVAIINRFIADLVDVYDLLGTIAHARCDEEGFVFYEEALRVCRERDLPSKTAASIHHGYGRLHAACGRPAEARAYLELARETYSTLGFGPELDQVAGDLDVLPPATEAA